ncbi:hypothetical protein P389DRAFT_81657 [Cystobasidium minutum MCA 4210]|uniref:uncharacterized protein n=1 Tax=Cystobasidium minutum MCA 4210 TaxID=1397322 RepID=UPI0034CFD608|eukprot:jgi/Rhomi1/81657/CE81656_1114
MRAAFQKQQDEEARARREDEMKGEQAASSKRRKRNQTRGHDPEHGDDSDDEDEDDEDAGNSEISDEDHEAELRGERASQPSKKKRKTTSSSDQDEDDNEGGKHVVQQVKGSRGCLDIVKPKNITNMDFAGNLEGLVAGWKKGDWKKTLNKSLGYLKTRVWTDRRNRVQLSKLDSKVLDTYFKHMQATVPQFDPKKYRYVKYAVRGNKYVEYQWVLRHIITTQIKTQKDDWDKENTTHFQGTMTQVSGPNLPDDMRVMLPGLLVGAANPNKKKK